MAVITGGINLDKNSLNNLRSLDSSDVATSITKELTGNRIINNLHLKGVIIAYVLYVASTEKVELSSIDDFKRIKITPDTVNQIVKENIDEVWDIAVALMDKFNSDQLLSFILFNNDLEDINSSECSTPSGLIQLVLSILNIQENDNVLELCSGKGNFFTELSLINDHFDYLGIELNYKSNQIAEIRASLLQGNIKLILNDALEYRSKVKMDKLFSNYPFMLKSLYMSMYKEQLSNSLDCPIDIIQRASSDWIFNATLIEQMKDTGKAIAIMTTGATWNSLDRNMRKFFIEKGLVEAAIALPEKLFSSTNISTALVVFSHNNKSVRLVDARKCFVREHKQNILTKECISYILDYLKKDGEIVVTKKIGELAENDYVLNAASYLDIIPEVKHGVQLGSVAKFISRGAQIKASELEGIRSSEPTLNKYLTISNISDGIISIDEQYLKEVPQNFTKFCVKNNSIIITKTGTPEIKSAVMSMGDNTNVLVTGNLFIIELDESKVNPYYLQAFFASETGQLSLKSICTGSILPTISLSKLNELIIPMPPLEEQKTIADRYSASMDELFITRRRMEKILVKMKQIYDEEV